MYQVVLINNGIETVIHHSTADEQAPHLASMNLQMFENQSNIFNFVIYKHYSGYDDIVDLVTQIKIFDLQNGKIKYEGRILVATENMDSEGKFYKEVTCESELAYLNDSLVGRWELHPSTLPEDSVSYAEPNHTILTALTKIIDNHNLSVEAYKQFTIGIVEISGEVYFTTNHESSLDALIRNIISDNGVVIKIRKENGIRYLDILLDDPSISNTIITLSRNLKTFKKTPNYATFCTKLLAIGADGLTFESINNGKNYVENVEAIEQFGSITKSFEWTYITAEDELLQKAQTKLTEVLSNTYVSVEVTALDLNCIGLMPEEFNVSTKYLIENEVQNFSEVLKAVQLDLDLLAVWNSKLTFSNKPIISSSNATDVRQQVNTNRNETLTYNGRLTQKVIGVDERLEAYKEETDLAIVIIKTDVAEAQEDIVVLNQEVDVVGNTITNHTNNVNNPHAITKAQIGLSNVDNTSDLLKPISNAAQSALNLKINTSQKGVANGVAQLDDNGIIPSSQLPSYVDDVLEYTSNSLFPATGESGKIYLNTTNNLTYRWTGSGYAEISPSIALGETSSTAYAGDKGKTTTDNVNAHILNTTNPHNVTKVQVGLSNVPNLSTNNQTPTYTVASTNTTLTSGEILTTAFGKIAKAISSLINHLADAVSHITSTERANWNGASTNNHTHSNKTTLDNTTAPYTTTEQTKLSGIANNANNYALPVASAVIGGVKSGTDITIDASGNVSVNDDSHNHIIGNTDGLQTALDGKVDDNQVLTNVPLNAKFTDTVYVHPTNHAPSIITQDSSNRFVTDTEKDTWNAKQSALGFNPYNATNPSGYITSSGSITGSSNKIMSLDGDRNASTKLPTGSPKCLRLDFVSAGSANGGGMYSGLMTYSPWDGTSTSTGSCSYQLSFSSTIQNGGLPYLSIRNGIDSTWNAWLRLATDSIATTIANGLMSSTDKVKLSFISEGANRVIGSAKPGNILVDGAEVNIYTHPTGTNPHGTTKANVGLGSVDNTADSSKNVLSATKLTTPRTIFGKSFDGTTNIGGKAIVCGTYYETPSSRYMNGALEIRECDLVTTTQSDIGYAPQLGFHWSGRTGASLVMTSTGEFQFTNQAGTGYNNLRINTLFGNVTGNATSSDKLNTARTIATSGDVIGTATSFDGSANISIPLTLATVATAGTYKSVAVDAKGRVTSGTNPTTLAGYGITDGLLSSTYTASDVLTKIKTVDGAGSGLDADLLDGLQASAFALASHGTHVTYGATTTSLTSGVTGVIGSATTLSRSDHTHTLPAYPTLTSLGVISTSAELNYTDGVTSNIQTQLNSKATQTNIDTSINAIQIGGNNLILDTSKPFTVTGTGGANQVGLLWTIDSTKTASKQITVSYDVVCSVASGTFQLQVATNPWLVGDVNHTASTTKQHISYTYTMPSTTGYTRLALRLDYLTGTATISNLKIAIGNKELEWTPAIEDMAYKTTSGTTATRPTPTYIGQTHFDTTLGKPIWCKTVATPVWVDSTGTVC